MLKRILISLICILPVIVCSACGSDTEATAKLFQAIEQDDYKAAEAILKDGTAISLEDCKLAEEEYDDGRLLELSLGDEMMCKLLIDAGADLNSRNREGVTYLQELIEANDVSQASVNTMKLLLDSGAEVNAEGKGDYKGTALDYLMKQSPITTHHYNEIYNLLTDSGAEITEKTFETCMKSDSRFFYAAPILKNLNQTGHSPNISQTLRAVVLDQQDEEILSFIANGDYKKKEENDIIFFAAANCGTKVMEALKKEGFDLNQQTGGGLSLLDLASLANTPEMIEYLIGQGLELEEYDDCGYEAHAKDEENIVAFQRIADAASYTPLSLALVRGKADNVNCLLKAGAEFQESAWCIASIYGGKPAVDILLKNNYKPETYFVFQSYVFASDDMVRYMLEKGVDYNISWQGQTLLEFLRETGQDERCLIIEQS